MKADKPGYEIIIDEETHLHTVIPTGYTRRVLRQPFGIPVEWKIDQEALDQVKGDWWLISEEIQPERSTISRRRRGEHLCMTIVRRILWLEYEEDAILYKLAAEKTYEIR